MSTEEKKDQATEEYHLPERGYFQGDAMLDFMNHIEQIEPAKAPPPPAKKVKMKDGKPCPECPDEEAAKGIKAEERKIYKTLKVKGQELPIYSEEELVSLAQKGAHYTQERQKDSDWERDLEAREERLERLAPHIGRIVEFLDSGGQLPAARAAMREEPEPEEEILDPVAARKFKSLEGKLQSLEKENTYLKQQDQSQSFERAQKDLTETFSNVTKEHPFEQVLDEDRRNISQELFSGLVAFKINRDALRMRNERGFKMKTMTDYFADGAKDLSYLEKHFRGNSAGEISAEVVKTKFPKVAEILGQEAIDAYLKSLEDKETPVIRPTKTEPSVRPPKRVIKSIADGLEQGLDDPEIAQGLEELARKYRLEQGG